MFLNFKKIVNDRVMTKTTFWRRERKVEISALYRLLIGRVYEFKLIKIASRPNSNDSSCTHIYGCVPVGRRKFRRSLERAIIHIEDENTIPHTRREPGFFLGGCLDVTPLTYTKSFTHTFSAWIFGQAGCLNTQKQLLSLRHCIKPETVSAWACSS